MSLDEIDEYAEPSDDPPPISTAPHEEEEWSSFDLALYGLSHDSPPQDLPFSSFDVPTGLLYQGTFANPQYTANSLETMHLATPIHTAQHVEHQPFHHQPTASVTGSTQEQSWVPRRVVFPMACPNCLPGYCQHWVPPSGTYEGSTDVLDLNAQESRRTTGDQNIVYISPDFVNGPTNSRSQRVYANSEYTDTRPVNTTQGLATNHLQAMGHGYNLTSRPYTHPIVDGASFITQEPTLGHTHPTSIEGTAQIHRNDPENHGETIRCHWKGCRYKRTFSRRYDLDRHTRSIHTFPRAFRCPECGREFNRRENLQGHLERIHGVPRPRR